MRRLLALALLAGVAVASVNPEPIRPAPGSTPGAILTTDAVKVCVPGYSDTVRKVSSATKRKVFATYGIRNPEKGRYEIDHLVPLSLGGSNHITNLWPQSYGTETVNAKTKNRLEWRLYALVCDGKVKLKDAQKDIATDWIKAYRRYVGPLKGGG